MNELETKIQGRVTKYLRKHDIPYIKTTGYGSRGWPDITACVRGRFLALEMKRPGNTPTPKQEAVLEDIRANKGIALSYDNSEDAVKAIDILIFNPDAGLNQFPESLRGKEVVNVNIQ